MSCQTRGRERSKRINCYNFPVDRPSAYCDWPSHCEAHNTAKENRKQAKTRLPIWKCNGKVKTLPYSFETVDGSCATSSKLIRKVHCGLYRQTVADRCWQTRDCNILQSNWLNERKMTLKCLLSWRLLGNGNLNPLAFGRLRWKDETRVMILCD